MAQVAVSGQSAPMTRLDRRTFLAASTAAATLTPSLARAREGGWSARAALPWATQEIYAAACDGRIITAGGLKAVQGQPLHIEDRVGAYDPATDRWTELPRLPAPRHHPMLIDHGRMVFALGGYGRGPTGDWTNMTTGWILTDGEWTPGYTLPEPQAEAVGARLGRNLHLVTGRTPQGEANGQWADQADTDAHWVLSAGSRWEKAAPCPMARNSAAGAVLDGALWVAGGRTVNGGGTGRLDRYDPATDRWDTLAPIPPSPATGQQVGGGLALAAAGGKLVAFGGEWFRPRAGGGGGGVFAETWIYDPGQDRWTQGPDMATPRHGLAAVAVVDTIYAVAGGSVVSGGNATGIVERLTL